MKSILNIDLSRSADTEAPDQKTRFIRKKKNKKKKKRKKPVHNGTDQSLANLSNESIEEDKTESKEEEKSDSLISCSSDQCEKKFTSESALKYHVTFAHQKIKRAEAVEILPRSGQGDRNVSNNGVMSHREASDDPANKQDTNGTSEEPPPPAPSAGGAGEPRREGNISNSVSVVAREKEKVRRPAFPSTQHIRPILPAQGPQIPGAQLKPIQPKPALLPPPQKSLNLDTLKKPLLNKSPVNHVKCEPGPESGASGGSGGAAMDLSNGGAGAETERKPVVAELKRELKTESPPKSRTPMISIKSEFNTGIMNKSLSDPADRDELEVLKHISKAPAPGSFPPEYLNPAAAAAFGLSSPLAPGLGGLPGFLGLHAPPSSTASHLLPGLMGLPGVGPPGPPGHPGTATPLSPFGASLESLARAAEERARSFGGGFSPAALPGVPGAHHSPGAPHPGPPGIGRPGPVSGGAPPPGGGLSGVPGAPPTSESGGDPPLLRHEHMHTHLHYITSPTHGQ